MIYINIIHRPAPGELKEMFLLQQDIAHSLNLKVTVLVPYDFLFCEETVTTLKEHQNKYGDEIGIWFGEIAGGHMSEVFECKEPFLWLHSKENKKLLIDTVFHKFQEAFGFMPSVAGAYHVDAVSMKIMKEVCPHLDICIGGCFEEGVKVYHGCNNSWYLFNEGMPWAPWYPSVDNTLCPAQSEDDWCEVVAVPHLSRDLVLSYEGRNDFFASHPANVQRAMANDGACAPYTLNLLDMYRYQERFNGGYAYTNVFVGPNWLQGSPYVQDSDEITQGLYREYLGYFTQLREQGQLADMHMSEFAKWYQANISIDHSEVYAAREILYGSDKEYFWYISPYYRLTFDMCQGGSIGDLRPYISRHFRSTGADTKAGAIGTNPYLIHSQYRTGNAYHYADGTRTTLMVYHNGQICDLADYPVEIESIDNGGEVCTLVLTPAEIIFHDGYIAKIVTKYQIYKDGKILISRRLAESSDASVSVTVTEYCKGCWGVTEYPEPMEEIQLSIEDFQGNQLDRLRFSYLGRTMEQKGKHKAAAAIPPLQTVLELQPENGEFTDVRVTEGYRFSPYYTLETSAVLAYGEEVGTWLQIKKSI